MKTSFYFVLWISIYTVFDLLDNRFLDENAFFVAFAIVMVVSWMLNRIMSKTKVYEQVSQIVPVLEDVYSGNVKSFRKRLSRDVLVRMIVTIYLFVTVIAILLVANKPGDYHWVELLLFLYLALFSAYGLAKLVKANIKLNGNPTPEQCMDIADNTYELDYASYYEYRQGATYQDMFPTRPAHYRSFLVTSFVIAIICVVLGLFYLGISVGMMVEKSYFEDVSTFALAVLFLYGSMATYYGIKDIAAARRSLRNPVHRQESGDVAQSISENNQ